MNNLLQSLINLILGIIVGGLIWLVSMPPRGQPVQLGAPSTPGPLVVHVAGAVAEPGVYELPPGDRIRDAVNAAGGLLPESNTNGLNLAKKLTDGEQIFVYEVIPGSTASAPAAQQNNNLLNINTATASDFQRLPGIGPSISQRIIEYRNIKGAFEDKISIMEVSGIGPATYDNIKNLITVDR